MENSILSPYGQIMHLAFNWHRDDKGRDIYSENGVSIGQILSCSAVIAFSTLYREYYALKSQVRRDASLVIPADATRLQKKVAQKLSSNVILSAPRDIKSSAVLLSDERFLRQILGKNRFGTILGWIQNLLFGFFFLRNRQLFIADWTFTNLALRQKRSILLNAKSVFRGAYLPSGRKYTAEAEKIFRPNWLEQLSSHNLVSMLKARGIEWDSPLLELCVDYLKENYLTNRAILVANYACLRALLEKYKPSALILPGEIYEPFMVAIQIAKQLGITSKFMPDGYSCLSMAPYTRNENDSDFLFDNYFAFGKANAEHFLMRGVQSQKIEIITPPLMDWHQKQSVTRTYDAMIMTWMPYHINPNCDTLSPAATLRSVFRVLKALRISKIAVKVKSKAEIEYVKLILTEEEIEAEILTGLFYLHVQKAKMVIGGISTGVIETYIHEIPYILFEPLENGFSDEIINQSAVLDRSRIARDETDLGRFITERRTACVKPRKYILNQD